jgi:hypothetical protein
MRVESKGGDERGDFGFQVGRGSGIGFRRGARGVLGRLKIVHRRESTGRVGYWERGGVAEWCILDRAHLRVVVRVAEGMHAAFERERSVVAVRVAVFGEERVQRGVGEGARHR